MNYYRNPDQLKAAVETANAMARLCQQHSPEELTAMGFDLSSHADPSPEQPYAHVVTAEMLRQAYDATAGIPLGKILFDEHHRSVGLLTDEELALKATQQRAQTVSEGTCEVNLTDAPLASLRAADVDTPYTGALALEAGGVKIDSAIS